MWSWSFLALGEPRPGLHISMAASGAATCELKPAQMMIDGQRRVAHLALSRPAKSVNYCGNGVRASNLRVIGSRSTTTMEPSWVVDGGRHATNNYVKQTSRKNGPYPGRGRSTPHIRVVHIRRKMLSSPFFAERGLL